MAKRIKLNQKEGKRLKELLETFAIEHISCQHGDVYTIVVLNRLLKNVLTVMKTKSVKHIGRIKGVRHYERKAVFNNYWCPSKKGDKQ